MDHYIYRMQQGKRGTQGHGKHKAKVVYAVNVYYILTAPMGGGEGSHVK